MVASNADSTANVVGSKARLGGTPLVSTSNSRVEPRSAHRDQSPTFVPSVDGAPSERQRAPTACPPSVPTSETRGRYWWTYIAVAPTGAVTSHDVGSRVRNRSRGETTTVSSRVRAEPSSAHEDHTSEDVDTREAPKRTNAIDAGRSGSSPTRASCATCCQENVAMIVTSAAPAVTTWSIDPPSSHARNARRDRPEGSVARTATRWVDPI